MKIAIMGAGGLGGYFGARLVQAGHDVTFVARGAHLAAIRANGLRVISENGDAHLTPVKATDDPASAGTVDLAILSVKLWDTEAAAAAAKPLLGPKTAIVSLQNGVEKDDVLVRVLGREHVIGGVSYIAAKIGEPGTIEHTGKMARILLGELDGKQSERVDAFVAVLAGAGIDAQAAPDIKKAVWEKFVFLAGLAGTTTLLRSSAGPIRENPAARSLLADAMREVVNTGRAVGIALDPEFSEKQMAFVDTIPPQMRASMAVDLERGRKLELPWLNGAVVRLAAQRGVATPVNDVIVRALALYQNGTDA